MSILQEYITLCGIKLYTGKDIDNITNIFNALSSPTRLKILLTIIETKRPLHIKAVAKALDIDYAAIHRHVKILKKANLLEVYDVGRSRVLSPTHIDLIKQFLQLAQKCFIS